MRYIIFLSFFFTSSNLFGQPTIKGQILSIVDSLPIPDIQIRVDNKKILNADSSGIFTIVTSKRKIRLSCVYGFLHSFDTLITVARADGHIKLYTIGTIDSSVAKYDLVDNQSVLFCGGGFLCAPHMYNDEGFKSEYNVQYYLLGCVMPAIEGLISYNKAVANNLDAKFGLLWRDKLRYDVHGVSRK